MAEILEELFAKVSYLRRVAGIACEAVAQYELQDGFELELIPMVRLNLGGTRIIFPFLIHCWKHLARRLSMKCSRSTSGHVRSWNTRQTCQVLNLMFSTCHNWTIKLPFIHSPCRMDISTCFNLRLVENTTSNLGLLTWRKFVVSHRETSGVLCSSSHSTHD